MGNRGDNCNRRDGINSNLIRINPVVKHPAGFGRVLTKKPKSNGYGLGFIFKKYREA